MMQFIFNTLWGWYGTAIILIAIAALIFYVFPQLRAYALAGALVVVSILVAFQKGRNTKANEIEKRNAKAIKQIQEKYNEIDNRTDTDSDVVKRMRDGDY